MAKLAEQQKWKACGMCGALVGRTRGCNHMRCICGHEYCYKCGETWKDECPNNCPLYPNEEDENNSGDEY